MTLRFQTLDSVLQGLFKAYSPYLIRYWFVFVAVPPCLTTFLCWGFVFLAENKVSDSNVLYTPTNAPSWDEKRKVEQLWPLDRWKFQAGRNFQVSRFLHVIVTAKISCNAAEKEECNLLRDELLDEIYRLDKDIVQNVTVLVKKSGKSIQYDPDLCLGWYPSCFRSTEMILPLLKNRKSLEKAGIKVTYPRANQRGTPIYLAVNLGGVKTDPDDGTLTFVSAFRLIYLLRNDTEIWNELSEKWEEAASEFARNFNSKLLNVYTMHSRSIDIGMYETTSHVQPYVAVTFATLFTLALFCSLKWSFDGKLCISVDWIRSKPLLAASGILTAGMGILSGIGALLLSQFYFIDILTVIPFLIISIGVDDMFIMIAAWHQTDHKDSLNDRIRESLSEAATAITITSLTDALSFAVGCATFIPAVRCFCAYAAACVAFNYLYQVTFFAGCMVLAAKLEERECHSVFFCFKPKSDRIRDSVSPKSSTSALSGSRPKLSNNFLKMQRSQENSVRTVSSSFFRNFYGPFLLHPVTETAVFILLVIYLTLAIWGCTRVTEGLDYRNLMLRTDPTIDFIDKDSEFFQDGWQAEVVFNRPPDLTTTENREKVLGIVRDFESSPFVVRDATQFFLREYRNYLNLTGSYEADTREIWINALYSFTTQRFAFVKQWSEDVAWKNADNPKNLSMKAFRFRVGLSRFIEAEDQRSTIWNLRKIAKSYPEYEITTFGHMWQFADQFAIVLPNTLQNIAIALVCMIVVSLFFIPNPICTVWITLAIVSIGIIHKLRDISKGLFIKNVI